MPVMENSSPVKEQRPVRFTRNKLAPYKRCQCGYCRECLDNQKWDRIFAKFEVNVYWDERGVFQSTLGGL